MTWGRVVLLAAVFFGVAACGAGAFRTPPDPTNTPVATVDATLPPVARLSAEGGDPIPGQLGSFTWGGGGSDSPWLPGTPISVGAGEPLMIAFDGDPVVGSWTARRIPADAPASDDTVPVGRGGAVVAFDAPEPGAWSVAVTIRFGGDDTATYYWRLDVS